MRRILVVDDDLHTRLAIRTWLSRCGFRVAIADGGGAGRRATGSNRKTAADPFALAEGRWRV